MTDTIPVPKRPTLTLKKKMPDTCALVLPKVDIPKVEVSPVIKPTLSIPRYIPVEKQKQPLRRNPQNHAEVDPNRPLSIKKQVDLLYSPPLPQFDTSLDRARFKEEKKRIGAINSKIKVALLCRLKVHKKSTEDLKKAKHPMRIICLTKMLVRLNKHIREINHLVVSYDEVTGDQIITKIEREEKTE